MTEGAAASSTSSEAPDWNTISGDVLCPLCDYNLRGLVEPRCPECGHRSTWKELLDQRPPHPFLFEYPMRRNVWSFTQTINISFLPRAFWESVRPGHPVRPSRLLLYWLVIAGAMLVVGLPIAWIQHSSQNMGWPIGWLMASLGHTIVPVLAVALAWPWLTLASLMIYRATIRQARIHWQHVLRCVLYSSDIGLLAAVPLGLIASAMDYPLVPWSRHDLWPLRIIDSPFIWMGAFPLILLMGYRLDVAYRRYLNFPDVHRAVFASQVIVALASLKICLFFSNYL